jgi:hypothetical protein
MMPISPPLLLAAVGINTRVRKAVAPLQAWRNEICQGS